MFRCASDTGPALNNYQDSLSSFPSTTSSYNYRSDVPDANGNNQIIATSNYIGVAGTSDSTTPPVDPTAYGRPTGMMFENSRVGTRDITDGTSNTLMVGERAWRIGKGSGGIFGAGNVLGFSASNTVQSTSASVKAGMLNAVGIGYDGINATINGNHDRRGFSSNHVGGAHFVLADGSVRFISENFDYAKNTVTLAPYPSGFVTTTFARLLTYWDGQPVGDY
jgi:hypothetical protein